MAFLAIAAAVVGAAGTLYQGYAQMQAGEYQNQVAKMNAKIAEQNATRAVDKAQKDQVQSDIQSMADLGEQRAIQSASGLSVASRSSIRVRSATIQRGRMDAENIRQAGDVKAYNYKVDAANERAQGSAALAAGRNAFIGSAIGATGSLLGAASSYKTKNTLAASGGAG